MIDKGCKIQLIIPKFFAVKFTSDGRKEGQEIVEGTADIGLMARATVVADDSNGFVFVAGTIGNIDSAADFVIMKIDGRSSRKHVLCGRHRWRTFRWGPPTRSR